MAIGIVVPVAASPAQAGPPPTPGFGPQIDPYQPYDGQDTCSPTDKAGVKEFRDLVTAAWPVTGNGNISRDCHIGGRSEHKEGRAWDWPVNVNDAAEKKAASELLSWLLATDEHGNKHALARRFGIMYIIWNRQVWKSYGSTQGKWTPYTGSHPHTDHIHFSFGWDGARKKTSWFGGGAPPARDVVQSTSGDFDGDGKDDVITFTRGSGGDVYVATSNGKRFIGTGTKWHDWFAIGSELPLIGDFNGDGKDDIATFTRGPWADVYVALSNGRRFNGTSHKWHDHFAVGKEVPAVGDFNGDGKDDIATFTRGSAGDVYVATSNGKRFKGSGSRWHDWFGVGNEIPAVGDFDGDGKDDVVAFTRGDAADVYVATSNGVEFDGTGTKWHDFFAVGGETPMVANINGDTRDDIVTLLKGSSGDIYAATSNGSRFRGTGSLWHPFFSIFDELPGAGDFNGDGKDDLVTFLRGPWGDVYTTVSNGKRFVGNGTLWHDWFSIGNELPHGATQL